MRIVMMITLLFLSGCAGLTLPLEIRRVIHRLSPELESHHVTLGNPVFIRIFKEENILELWMKPDMATRYSLFKTYSICNWSGALGPKSAEGDRQAPEGFYATDLQNLNPQSQYHLSFNIQFPNDYDRAHHKTGSYLMVHGGCASEGCYAMRDRQMEEIYVLIDQALKGGQTEVPVHIFPFHMKSDRLRMEFASPHYYFWRNLQKGYDFFETHGIPPKWMVQNKEYVFY